MDTATIPLYRAAQVRELDRVAIEAHGIPGYTLMTRARQRVFHEINRRWPGARRPVVVCGAGNNGGDGYVVAALARAAGLDARVLSLVEISALRGDARRAADDWLAAGGTVQPFAAALLADSDLIVDALLGTGLDREVQGTWREAIEAMNKHAAAVMAVDIPSGLMADTGAVATCVVKAATTVTFIGRKQGLYTGQGPACCGELYFDDLGVPRAVYDAVDAHAELINGATIRRLLRPRDRGAHKGDFGHVLVIGGDIGMAGAVRLAAEAAARSGAGLVSVATRPANIPIVNAGCPELMCHGVDNSRQLAPLLARADVVVVGPGLGQSAWAAGLLGKVLEQSLPLVVDADALNLLSGEPVRRDNWVLTPHPGEAARLLAGDLDIQADRFAAVNVLVERFGGVTVLKGAGTLIGGESGVMSVCDRGNPGMASGGMGDVLAGCIGGLLAQGLPLLEAARLGVYVHASAADGVARHAGERGMLASDLFSEIRSQVNP